VFLSSAPLNGNLSVHTPTKRLASSNHVEINRREPLSDILHRECRLAVTPEAIIVSLVRSNDANNSGFLTFPEEGPRRLNVAVTRARKRLVLVGDWDTLGTDSEQRVIESVPAGK
jgi:hypothetical protein